MNNNNVVVNEEGAVKEKKHPVKKMFTWLGEHALDIACYVIMAGAGAYTLWAYKKSSEIVGQQKEATRLQIEGLQLDNELKRKELQEIPEVVVPEIDIPE